MCGLRVDGLVFFIKPSYFLHIRYSEKWMTSAFTNVRAVKAKIVPTKTITESQHYILSPYEYIVNGGIFGLNSRILEASSVPVFNRIIHWPRGEDRFYPLPHQSFEVRVAKFFGANNPSKEPI